MKLDPQDLEEVEIPDLRRLKALSDRLHLSPKRESVLQWQDDIKELQSEGIYPTPTKANIPERIRDQYDNGALKASACRKLDFTTEQAESKESAKLPPKIHFECVPELKITHAPLSGANLRHSAREKYFRRRSPEECRLKVKKYALRKDLESDKNSNDLSNDPEEDNIPVSERYRRIGLALERVRTDLLNMRIHDNALARQLLDKHRELLHAKAEKTCEEHASMIEDFSFELELEEELTEQLRSFDLPSAFLRAPNSLLLSTSPLRHIGITRLTLDSKRFSVI